MLAASVSTACADFKLELGQFGQLLRFALGAALAVLVCDVRCE